MIRETLELLRTGSNSLQEIADRMGVGVEDLRQRLKIMEDSGFIKSVSAGGCLPSACGCHCPGCGVRSSGAAPQPVTGYVLTEKGKRVLTHQH
jgi:predicted ArsR family transcriptional regulator